MKIGFGYAYLPLADGTVKLSDTISMNIGSSYLPVLAHFRLDFRHVFFGIGSGYGIIAERPRVFGVSTDSPAGPVGVYVSQAEVGFKIAVSEKVTVYSSLKGYALTSSSTTYVLVPGAGVQLNLQ